MEFRHNVSGGRFEAVRDDEVVGFVSYRLSEPTCAMEHTIVPDEYSGQGIAGRVVAYALDSARQLGWSVLPYCSFISSYIGKHEDYLDLVPEDARAEFDL